MTKSRNGYLNTSEMAIQLGFTPDYIRRLIRQGKIKAEKFGTKWFIKKHYVIIKRQRITRDRD